MGIIQAQPRTKRVFVRVLLIPVSTEEDESSGRRKEMLRTKTSQDPKKYLESP